MGEGRWGQRVGGRGEDDGGDGDENEKKKGGEGQRRKEGRKGGFFGEKRWGERMEKGRMEE